MGDYLQGDGISRPVRSSMACTTQFFPPKPTRNES
jgi:hypothetical protein